MPKIDSPLGSKTISGTSLREFNVPDASGTGEAYTAHNYHFNAVPEPPGPQGSNGPGPHPQGAFNHFNLDNIQAFQNRVNAEQDTAQIEREVQAAKAARARGGEKMPEGARRRIEMLIGMTRHQRSTKIGEVEYTFQSLNSKEMREAYLAASDFDGTLQFPFELRRQLLARSIVHIANLSITDFLSSSSLEARLSFIDELDDRLSLRLYDEYLLLANEVKEQYALKPENVEEVKNDLGK